LNQLKGKIPGFPLALAWGIARNLLRNHRGLWMVISSKSQSSPNPKKEEKHLYKKKENPHN